MQRYKYRAINNKGRPIRGVVAAASEIDLHKQLQSGGLELIACAPISEGKGPLAGVMPGRKVKLVEVIQLFQHLEQMQGAGVPLLSALSDIRDAADNPTLRDIMSEIYRDVSEGSSLSEAMKQHPRVFATLHTSLIASGEETGDMSSAYLQLIKYLKWVNQMQAKVRKATRYPMIVTGVVIITVLVMMVLVVPQIVSFIENLDQEIPFYTTALMATSRFFVANWAAILIAPFVIFIGLKVARGMSQQVAYRLDAFVLSLPIAGPLIRKINIARFAQTFGSLYASGVDVLKSLESARRTVTNLALVEALEGIQEQVQTGSPLSEAFNASGEFPSLVTRMLKVGEESGNLTEVLDQVSDYYTDDVDEAIQALISMIEPALTGFLGGMIAWIAIAVFGPIYSSFENIDF